MDILDSLKMAGTTLAANRLRSALTILGIVIGNASVIGMVGVGQGAQRLAAEQFESLGPNLLFVSPGQPGQRRATLTAPKTLVLEDAKAIATQVPAIKEVSPQIQNQQQVTYGSKNISTLVIGTNPEFLTVRSFDVERGRFINEQDLKRNNRIAILGPEVANKLFGIREPIGQQIRIKNISFEVVGVTKPKGSFLGSNQDDAVFVPITTLANRIIGRTSVYGLQVTFISVTAQNPASMSAAQFQIRNLLRLRHKITGEDDFTVRTQEEILTIVNTITGALTIMLGAIAAISLVVGGIGVMNIMLVSVTERTQEIGLRKALGATQQDILIQFLIEAVILATAGGLVGTAIGMGGISLVSSFTPLKASVAPMSIFLAIGVSSGIGLFFGVVPAQRAARLDPIVALRSA
ncbi:MAG: ABC transporter permease [Cyanosarcina radialis HA8281-LM2]|jgi:putative ABC transport system permease protein|nr:ABC transporter permease [Cyanosarcina radialis HA8281-LM2]